MKRDMDIVRSILLTLEKDEKLEELNLPEDVLLHHLDLLFDAGLLEGESIRGNAGQLMGASIRKITWQGYDFIASAQSDSLWSKAKEKLVTVGGSASLEIMKAVLQQITKAQLGLP